MRRLLYVLRDNELIGALEYDLRRYLQVDIRGLFRTPRELTYRQVASWLDFLPSDSALVRRGFGGDTEIGLPDRLAAEIVNQLRVIDWHYLSAHSKETPDPPDLIEWG